MVTKKAFPLRKALYFDFSDSVVLHQANKARSAERNLHHDLVCCNRKAICELPELARPSYRECARLVRSIPKYLISMDSEQFSYRRKYYKRS